MKFQFKQQAYQTAAVNAVVDCFVGQPHSSGLNYRMDPGQDTTTRTDLSQVRQIEQSDELEGFRNAELALTSDHLLENIQKVQQDQNLFCSEEIKTSRAGAINLDVEMETGTGKTYCYIKTIFELHKRYGWSKYIIVVPSIAIREGVYKSLQMTAEHFQQSYGTAAQMTAEHFQQSYGTAAKYFIYNSKLLSNLESFSSDAGINIMVINVQAFNATGKDNRRIYEKLDSFQSRKPIDVISANRPILILDEPQKMEGAKTLEGLQKFKPLFLLRYSATHKTEHNLVHRLDALDAYNQKLVKKIAVHGISVQGLAGSNAYLYLQSIEISKQNPKAVLEFEIKQKNGIQRKTRKLEKGAQLYELSRYLEQYKEGFIISEINAHTDTLEFSNGLRIQVGIAYNDMSEATLRRIQIRESIRAHLGKEERLFSQGIKVLSLFFIDQVDKYRQYTAEGEQGGEYAAMFEEEYESICQELLLSTTIPKDYKAYLEGIAAETTHNGYFSKDKKGKFIDSKEKGRGEEKGCDDVAAYDLILKNKERLLSFAEPTRFIFSHSALREGWDNPNVFVICTLKQSDNTISRRQEVGRGMRLAVNQHGQRQDNPTSVHEINELTVVASESYQSFVAGLQKDISETLKARPRRADAAYFAGKVLQTTTGTLEISGAMAGAIEFYLIQNAYVDINRHILEKYHQDKKNNALCPLPEDLQAHTEQIFQLVDSVFSDKQLEQQITDASKNKLATRNEAQFNSPEFQELWRRINKKAVYRVDFSSADLVKSCITALNEHLRVAPLRYTLHQGIQKDQVSRNQVEAGTGFDTTSRGTQYSSAPVGSSVRYDLIGTIAVAARLTRKTVQQILAGIDPRAFAQFNTNPEEFISQATRLIQERKGSGLIAKLGYDTIKETYDIDIFPQTERIAEFHRAYPTPERNLYDYLLSDSNIELSFAEELEKSKEVMVYAKLPKHKFSIPTPIGDYSPDWAIAFREGLVQHVYFVAETKGSPSELQLREIEKIKIECAKKFFSQICKDARVEYTIVNSYEELMRGVQLQGDH